jgi:hypothetical protein
MARTTVAIDRPGFRVYCEEQLREQAEWLSDVASSYGAKPGSTIQFGWSVLKFVPIDGELVLCEPAFSGSPLQDFRPDVSTSLGVSALQAQLLSRAGCTGEPTRFDDRILIQKGCLENPRVFGSRQEPKPTDCGWYIGPAMPHGGGGPMDAPGVDDLEAVWSYQLLEVRPVLLSMLGLPAGWLCIWNGTTIESLVDPDGFEH